MRIFFVWSITAWTNSGFEGTNVEVGDSSVGELIWNKGLFAINVSRNCCLQAVCK
jgi:hypothetical protein